jgi:uncharacterized protein with beta-barrel porin domain
MRINKVQLAGLAVALAGVAAGPANAEDVTISTATTTPLSTSDPGAAAPVEAGDITIADGGAITITAGQTAITVDSSNDVTLQTNSRINANNADNVTGILLEGGNTGTITNGGLIALVEDHTPEDLDNDDEPDEPFAVGVGRTGVWLQSGPAFVGDIVNSGVISVEGNQSYGIRVDALLDDGGTLTGSITQSGSISVTGDDTVAIAITDTGGVAGDLIIRGAVAARGENAVGLLVDGQVDGEVRINGSWVVTGFRTTTQTSDDSDLDPDDKESGGAAIHIRDDVLGGVTIEGIGVENDEDDDGDGVDESDTGGDSDDNVTANVTVYGDAPAILVEADAASGSFVLGANSAGYGLQTRGIVIANGVYDEIDATAIRLQGEPGASVTVNGGIAIDSGVQATAYASVDGGAEATALHIGGNVITPNVRVNGVLLATVISDEEVNAYALRLDEGADVDQIINRGTIRARIQGETGTATAILDDTTAGTVSLIENGGSIIAEVVQTDDDVTDGIDPPPVTGASIAIDLRNSTENVLIHQHDMGDLTDDDADNDVEDVDIQILGNILLGGGDDTIDLEAGVIRGDVSFGGGADAFNIDNGAEFYGRITNTGGTGLNINVIDGALYHAGGATDATSFTLADGSTFGIVLSETPGQSTAITVNGTATIGEINFVPVLPDGLPETSADNEYVFLTATTLNVDPSLLNTPLAGEGLPFLYNLTVTEATGNPNALQANYDMKSAAQLGLTSNQTAAFDPLIEALRLDEEASAAFANLSTQDQFFDAYEDLMPSYSSAAAEVATTAIQQMQGATSNRLSLTRLQGLDEVSVWAQEIGYAITRTPPTSNGQEFEGTGFGMAVGIDGPLNSGDLFGLSASFLASEVEEAGRPEGEISTWFGQLNAYWGGARGPIDLDVIAGIGAGQMQSRRFVEIGDDFSAQTEADWWAFEGHASVRASAPMRLTNWLVATPQVGLTYVGLSEQSYTEEGGGAAIDYDVDGVFSQRLWVDAGMELSGNFAFGARSVIAPRVFVGYRANAIDEEAERTVRFVSGGDDFTLIDEGLGDGGPIVGIGIDASNGYSTFSLGYEGEFGDQIERHSINAAIRFRF